jgi:periplasmic divalent cation tolerance protein
VTIKTRSDLFAAVAAAIRARHPYELPEILAVPVSDGTDDYLAWIDAETRPR